MPDSGSQYAASFISSVAELDDADLDAISARVDEAEKMLAQPYPDLDEAPAKAPASGAPAKQAEVLISNEAGADRSGKREQCGREGQRLISNARVGSKDC